MKKLKNLMKKLLYFRKKEVEDIKDESVVPVSQWLCKSKIKLIVYPYFMIHIHSFMYPQILKIQIIFMNLEKMED